MQRSRRLTTLVGLLALSLTAASSCNRKPAPQGTGKLTPSPGVVSTPPPIPPTRTLRPGAPTPLPELPG